MSRYTFPPELMAKFYDGNATAEETMMILHAAEKDSKLKEEIEFMYSFPENLMKAPAKIIAIQPAYIQPMLKAAQNKDLKAASDCVVRCEHEILKSYQPEVLLESLRKLSEENKWLQEGGTPLYNIGRILENYKLSIVRRYDCDLDTISQELQGGCQVIVAVNAEKLYGKKDEGQIPNHAVVVKSIDNNAITLFDPQYQREDSYGADQFLSAWKDSQFYMVSAAERGLRVYEPQPIDVSDFPLEGELKELIEAIAENNHEVWAKDRKKEGIEYGPVRDEKHNPDMLPYSDLPESEKEYDRKAARGILELVQRLGYKIIKEE